MPILLLFCGSYSCKNKHSPQAEIQQMVNEWQGKQVQEPDSLQCSVGGKDAAMTVCMDLWSHDYKLLLYVHMDSGSCSGCKVRFFEWKPLIAEAGSLFHGKLSFVIVLSATSKKDMYFLLRSSAMNYPVFIDREDEVNRLNNFPTDTRYQCFLLDKDNRVLFVGNPTLNPKIWELYKEVITGKKAAPPEKQTTICKSMK